MDATTDRFEKNFSVRSQRPKCMRQSQILRVFFFLSLESVKALFIWSWVHDTASRRRTACNMPTVHANFPPFRVSFTVKNFTKRSMEISLTWSSHFPAHSKQEKNSLYTVVKFQEERHRCTEVMSHFGRD